MGRYKELIFTLKSEHNLQILSDRILPSQVRDQKGEKGPCQSVTYLFRLIKNNELQFSPSILIIRILFKTLFRQSPLYAELSSLFVAFVNRR